MSEMQETTTQEAVNNNPVNEHIEVVDLVLANVKIILMLISIVISLNIQKKVLLYHR